MLIGLSALTSVFAAAVAYATKVKEGDTPSWLVAFALSKRESLAAGLLGLSVLGTMVESARAYISERHMSKGVLQKLLEDLAKTLFGENAKRNRLTLFKKTRGWRVFVWALIKLPWFGKRHKWRALFRLKWRDDYLGVYLRPSSVRNKNSLTAFRISDQARYCEGVAGLVWEENFVMIAGLQKVDPESTRKIKGLADLPATDPIAQYARSTNVSDPILLKSIENPARHFFGTIIRLGDGRPWGVLLLDSEEDDCPFPFGTGKGSKNKRRAGNFGKTFFTYADLLGKVIG
jgi:hypothetical protein